MKRIITNLWRPLTARSESSSIPSPKTAIGVSKFKDLVLKSTVFVDKSLLVKDFLDNPAEALLLTYPRRWGKSINLDMIKAFLEIEVDEEGNRLAFEQRVNNKLFMGGEVDLGFSDTKLLKSLKVAEHQNITKFQGQFPVISIDFKNSKGSSYHEIKNGVKEQIINLYADHKYLEKYLNASERLLVSAQKQNLEKYFQGDLDKQSIKVGLKFLSKLLHDHFGKKAFILVDEYDSAINHSYIKFDDQESEKVVDLFRGIHETTFKGNEHLEKGLITGVFRIAKANLFSGLNNLSEFGITDPRFAPYYGFTQEEVDKLLAAYKVPDDLAASIKDWYNGYNIGEYQIYNPWSLVKALEEFTHQNKQNHVVLKKAVLRSYWEESGNIDFMRELLKVPLIKSKVDSLVEGNPLAFDLKSQISASDYKVLKQLIDLGSTYKIDESAADLLFSYLFLAGYLTGSQSEGFVFPNHEIRTEMRHKLLEHYKKVYSVDTKFFSDVTDQLQKILDSKDETDAKEPINGLKESFQELLNQFPLFTRINESSISDPTVNQGVHGNEAIVHHIMSYIALQLNTSKFGVEVHLGKGKTDESKGRADIVLIDEKSNKAVVIELKYGGSANKAFNQILDREYDRELVDKYDVFRIGINVSKSKAVDIEYELVLKSENHSGNGTNQEDNSSRFPYSASDDEGNSKDIKLGSKGTDFEDHNKPSSVVLVTGDQDEFVQ